MNTITNWSNSNTVLPITAMMDIFGADGVLAPYIVWFDSNDFKLSSRQIFSNKITLELWATSMVTFPKQWIRQDIVYDCFFGAEKTPRYRFRIGANKKALPVTKNLTTVGTDEHATHQKIVDQRDQNPLVKFQPKMLHIVESTVDTLGKREKIISTVKRIARKIPSRTK